MNTTSDNNRRRGRRPGVTMPARGVGRGTPRRARPATRRAAQAAGVLLVLAAATLSCSDSQPATPPTPPSVSASQPAGTTPGTPNAAVRPTTAGTPTSREPTLADRVSDPTEAVRRVVAAWRQGDRDAAGLVATPELVTTLFTRPAPAAAPRIQECTLDVPARYGCTVTPASGPSLQFVVEGGASAGYFVTGLTDSG